MTTAVNHENLARIQRSWDALAAGDPSSAFAMLADSIVLENGPLPGPERWVHCTGRDGVASMLAVHQAMFDGTLRQIGTCIHADDRIAVSVVHDEGILAGDRYATDVVAVMRLDRSGQIERLWFIEIDVERVADALG